ncbi:hypothetical protein BDV25DRAFT_140251 [Aspergillus avenaceus]|uniref:H-type lectin domain-containing protein n=1 Tax=Aspergillus avenaceus TaxID=36643 RepID=A0A5N6TV83_ASPAV|nr:hypothetical protein BDV25DRAFT_140251 [Aspergillus avenaceus]
MPPASSRCCFYTYHDTNQDEDKRVEWAIHKNPRNVLITVPPPRLFRDKETRPEAANLPSLGMISSKIWQSGQEIVIGFLAGSEWQRNQVKRYAPLWTRYANIRFTFLDHRPSDGADVLIGFDSAEGSWSSRGTDCSYFSSRGIKSMNLSWIMSQRSQADIRATILHQFGHALGLVHEHASPQVPVRVDRNRIFEDLNPWQSPWDPFRLDKVYPTDRLLATSNGCSIMLNYLPPYWTQHRMSLRHNTDLSEEDKDYMKFYYPPENHGVGYFNTLEIRSTNDPITLDAYIKTIPSRQKHADLIAGLTWIDLEPNTLEGPYVRVSAAVHEDRITAQIKAWPTSRLHAAGMAWLEIGPRFHFIQHGKFRLCDLTTPLDNFSRNSEVIEFSTPFPSPPTVVCFVTGVQVMQSNYRLLVDAVDVSSTRFTLKIGTWGGTDLRAAKVTWLAYPADQPGVASGEICTSDIRSWNQPQQENSAFTPFPTAFTKTPNVLLALKGFDCSRFSGLRLRVCTSLVTPTGFYWHIQGWTSIYSGCASYFAWED